MNRVRIYENFHIILWLLKDTCWLLHLKALGTIMVFPTLGMALFIAWKTRNDLSHFTPNLAVTFWISANITWMLGEFYEYEFRLPTFVLFGLGMLCICFYFYQLIKKKPD